MISLKIMKIKYYQKYYFIKIYLLTIIMRYSVILIAILLLIFAYIYFGNRKKYVELKEEKEDFKNVVVYRYDDLNI